MSAAVAGRPAASAAIAREHEPALRAGAFFALSTYASLQFSELLLHPQALRVIAIAAIATLGGVALSLCAREAPRALLAATCVLVLLVTLICLLLVTGVPAHMLLPSGWASFERSLRGGVNGLGAWLWPYRGAGVWSRLAVLLIVPVALLLAGALCFWPSERAASTRRACALALLLALFLTGAANTPATEPGLHGLLLLALIALWLWPQAFDGFAAMRAMRWLLVPVVLALVLMPALSSSSALVDFREAPGLATAASFQWDQLYGPIDWPRGAETMLSVEARHLGLLRVTSLDRFDGIRFLRSAEPPADATLDIPAAPRRRWLSRETIRIVGLRSRLLAGEGLAMAFAWTSGAGPALSRRDDGTIESASIATSGAYSITSYEPRPSIAEMSRAPRRFPRAYLPYTRFELPARSASGLSPAHLASEAASRTRAALVIQPPYPGASLSGEDLSRVSASPYGPVLRLAQGLAAGAHGSYEVAERIERYLLSNYSYDEQVPAARYPLEAFLFQQRRGYCQQFSGAMTLMLRMDGIPARVAAGFKPALYNAITRTWRIRPLDAHSWVEVFFPGIGWVSFDPTPAASGTLTGSALAAVEDRGRILAGATSTPHSLPSRRSGTSAAAAARPAGGVSLGAILALALASFALAALGGLWLRARRRLRLALAGDAAGAVAELSRALSKLTGQSAAMTLAQLERRLREDGEERAADYVRGLRRRRYEPAVAEMPLRGRFALCRALMRASRRDVAMRILLEMPPGVSRAR